MPHNGRFFVTFCVPEERRLAQFLPTTIPTYNYFLHAKTVTSIMWQAFRFFSCEKQIGKNRKAQPEATGGSGAHKKQL